MTEMWSVCTFISNLSIVLASFPGSHAREREIEVVHAWRKIDTRLSARYIFAFQESLGTRLHRPAFAYRKIMKTQNEVGTIDSQERIRTGDYSKSV